MRRRAAAPRGCGRASVFVGAGARPATRTLAFHLRRPPLQSQTAGPAGERAATWSLVSSCGERSWAACPCSAGAETEGVEKNTTNRSSSRPGLGLVPSGSTARPRPGRASLVTSPSSRCYPSVTRKPSKEDKPAVFRWCPACTPPGRPVLHARAWRSGKQPTAGTQGQGGQAGPYHSGPAGCCCRFCLAAACCLAAAHCPPSPSTSCTAGHCLAYQGRPIPVLFCPVLSCSSLSRPALSTALQCQTSCNGHPPTQARLPPTYVLLCSAGCQMPRAGASLAALLVACLLSCQVWVCSMCWAARTPAGSQACRKNH